MNRSAVIEILKNEATIEKEHKSVLPHIDSEGDRHIEKHIFAEILRMNVTARRIEGFEENETASVDDENVFVALRRQRIKVARPKNNSRVLSVVEGERDRDSVVGPLQGLLQMVSDPQNRRFVGFG